MEPNSVYQKTRKGDDEIKTRAAKLAPKVRTMLILIDGSKTRAQLDDMAKRLGAPADYAAVLEGQGLIARLDNAAAVAAPAGDELTRFSTARRFLNDTAVDALGMRSFFFVLKLEKCGTRSDLAALLEDYQKALTKASGADEAAALTAQARELLA